MMRKRATMAKQPKLKDGEYIPKKPTFLVQAFEAIIVVPLMKRLTFDQVVDLWWYCQAEAAKDRELHNRRTANPDDMYGKSREYVTAYYAAKLEGKGAPVEVV